MEEDNSSSIDSSNNNGNKLLVDYGLLQLNKVSSSFHIHPHHFLSKPGVTVPCSQYLCPATLHCVGRPIDCPCPSPEDIKCFVPDTDGAKGADGTVVCVRGEKGCASIEKMMKP